ncbi:MULTISPECIES: response regulator [Methanobacterium]|jgi:CheY-like chemotaxis protein|uniref:Response regulator n=1 Tax=Methanobacterium veterum TaxID=408577 RepID=A0A9E5DIG7_9EURY|nr:MULTISPECIES: response regulator [Methanobacterium]MCZ3365187.1 response regulator [Methanobacterium veterum]MCZ3372942.1 response regulator [Methanobacterium veterum]
MNVLIAENESKTILDLKKSLGNLKHTVVAVASSGEEAVQKAGNLNPDLVLMDIKLKGEMSGVEAANKIKDLYKIPVIFLTIFIKNCLIKSLQLPEDAIVLSKPVKQEHLEYGISRAVSERK